jgi:hypothetical protein
MGKPKRKAPQPEKKKTGFAFTPEWLTAIGTVLGAIAAIIASITGLIIALAQIGK